MYLCIFVPLFYIFVYISWYLCIYIYIYIYISLYHYIYIYIYYILYLLYIYIYIHFCIFVYIYIYIYIYIWAFMDDITVLVPPQIAADGLLQRYYHLFAWTGMKAKPKKSWSLSLVGGSVREIHFNIGGDNISTVREKPVKNLGRLYSIPLTDRHRGTEVQKVALKGFKSIDKTCLPGKMKAFCYHWESTPSHDDEGLSRRDHLEGVSRNKIRYEVVGH